jgi:hypothetical protein
VFSFLFLSLCFWARKDSRRLIMAKKVALAVALVLALAVGEWAVPEGPEQRVSASDRGQRGRGRALIRRVLGFLSLRAVASPNPTRQRDQHEVGCHFEF